MPEKAQRFNQDKCKVLDLTEKINCPKIVKKKKKKKTYYNFSSCKKKGDILVPDARPQTSTGFVFFLFGCVACGILVPQPEIEPGSLAVKVWSPNHCPAKEFPTNLVFYAEN